MKSRSVHGGTGPGLHSVHWHRLPGRHASRLLCPKSRAPLHCNHDSDKAHDVNITGIDHLFMGDSDSMRPPHKICHCPWGCQSHTCCIRQSNTRVGSTRS